MAMAHLPSLGDEYLLSKGFVITDSGPGLRRTAKRGSNVLDLEPRCLCEYCPIPDHPNYRLAAEWGSAA